MVTWEPASAVPVICGIGPTVVPAAGDVIVGTSVASSMVKFRGEEVSVFPYGSVAIAVMLCVPPDRLAADK